MTRTKTGRRKPKVKSSLGGRPTKLTPAIMKKVVEFAATGLNQRQIANIIGVNPNTISQWKLLPEFSIAIEKGQAKGIERRLKRIEKAGRNGSWQADAWTLERRYPEQFSRRTEITGPVGGAVEFKDFVVHLTADEIPKPKQIEDATAIVTEAAAIEVEAELATGPKH